MRRGWSTASDQQLHQGQLQESDSEFSFSFWLFASQVGVGRPYAIVVVIVIVYFIHIQTYTMTIARTLTCLWLFVCLFVFNHYSNTHNMNFPLVKPCVFTAINAMCICRLATPAIWRRCYHPRSKGTSITLPPFTPWVDIRLLGSSWSRRVPLKHMCWCMTCTPHNKHTVMNLPRTSWISFSFAF